MADKLCRVYMRGGSSVDFGREVTNMYKDPQDYISALQNAYGVNLGGVSQVHSDDGLFNHKYSEDENDGFNTSSPCVIINRSQTYITSVEMDKMTSSHNVELTLVYNSSNEPDFDEEISNWMSETVYTKGQYGNSEAGLPKVDFIVVYDDKQYLLCECVAVRYEKNKMTIKVHQIDELE